MCIRDSLASVAGLSTRTVQRLEADGNASIESRMAIAAVFGVEPAKLMQGQGPAGVDTLQGSTPKSTLRMDPYRWVLLIMVWIMSVSYTHLDVYKRQIINCE